MISGCMLIIFSIAIYKFSYFPLALVLALLLGILVSPIMIATNTIIHKVSDNDMMGKIFSSLEIVMHLGFILFMFVSSFLAERLPHVAILVVIGGIFSLLGIVNLIHRRDEPWFELSEK